MKPFEMALPRSVEEATRAYFDASPHRVVACPGDFNFSRIVNRGVEAAEGELMDRLDNMGGNLVIGLKVGGIVLATMVAYVILV